MDVDMLTKLLQRFSFINNRVVEPAQDQVVMYKALVQAKAHQLQGVVCDWRQQTIEQYEKAGDATKFHFISAVHSIYHVENVDSSLMYMYDHLEVGGVMLVMTIAGKIVFLFSRPISTKNRSFSFTRIQISHDFSHSFKPGFLFRYYSV